MHNLCATRETGTLMDKETITNDTSAENAEIMDAVPETTVVEELTKKYDELNDKYLRLAAEYENYRKRSKRDQENSVRYATEKFALDIVEVVDNFERALKSDDAGLREGLEQIHKFFLASLAKNGIEPMNAAGCQFDPELHEAIAALPSDKPDGEILDVAVAGYMLRDKVLRHAKVAVSSNNP
ncbi:nucleotide exchange factor GrpE [Methanocorpusculum sp.]|nr:nucleotide exchange factor GrpE [Methanocorpusculum sp.]